MGLIIKTELANKNIGLEIIYGGKEAPFGGIDTSAPPAYIDPRCAVDINGWTIVENQLVVTSLHPIAVTLTLPIGGVWANAKLSGFGNFYTKALGYQNFALLKGQDQTSPTANTMNLALYVWPSSNIATVAPIVFSLAQPITVAPGTPAVAIVETAPGTPPHPPPVLPIAQATVTISDGITTEVYGPYPCSDSQSVFANALVTDITGLPSVLVTAALGTDGVSAVLTTINSGAAENNLTVTVTFGSGAATFPGCFPYVQSGFQGGTDSYTYPSGVGPYPLSFVSEGERLILGGPGTAILQYTNGIFSLLSQYLGANVLKKFGGSLLALGITPSPGTVIDSSEMVFAWSAPSEFEVWNPVDSSGNVTGAGFEQLADIEDILTGGFVNSSTLLMLRAKGVSYATVTGNATLPFNVSHVDLASEGEGCQGQLLSSQYGPMGFYVGNSNIYAFVQNQQAIGDKIKSYIFEQLSPVLSSGQVLTAAKAVSVFLNGTETLFFAIHADPYTYLYNVTDGVWTRLQRAIVTGLDSLYLEDFPVLNNSETQFQKQSQLILGTGNSSTAQYKFFVLAEHVPNTDSLTNIIPVVNFPVEEIAFGRDITIDAIFVSMAGTEGQQVIFQVSDINGDALVVKTFTFPAGATYDTFANYQVFDGTTGMAKTGQAPQLTIQVPTNLSGVFNQVRIAKVAMFGSYDPTQRPV